MNRFFLLLSGLAALALAGCTNLGRGADETAVTADVSDSSARPEVRYYMIADT